MKQWERMWNKIEKEIVKSIWEVEGEVIMEPILVTLNLNKKMKVEVNTFNFATEGVFSIKCKDKK